ncbi:DUF4192 domain-containing protein [Streptomyces sp. CB02115]|uniref:DUF4192 domain-containing protein n=1 Tax=Streptomyces sp. CB02115 TaxID=1703939 RepID=UPI00093BDD1F|nr:DUF4192 domain-containing protein [Streptomyces sp. CB02115]OKJ55966.1 hypothetical protein AMK28_13975 [Streptomyces sp. CB02115]
MSPDNTVQVDSLPNLAQILPYLLGHYPDDSIAFHAPGKNFVDGPTLTCPLPEDPAEWQATAEDGARQFVAYANDQGHNPDQGVIIYLCREPRVDQTPWDVAALLAPVGDWLSTTLMEHRAYVLQTIGLVSNRWWAFDCPTEGCCEGEQLPSADDSTSITAQMARLGRTPGPRTRDLLAEFRATTPDLELLQDLHVAALRFNGRCATRAGHDATLSTTCTQINAAVNQFRSGATALNRALTTQLIVGLQDDAAVEAGMVHADDDDLPHTRRLWAYLARHCAEPFTQEAVPILTLFAFVAWRQGDLIAARLALRDAITTDPDYELAVGIHLAMIDGDDPREHLAAARESQARRTAHLQHAVQIASEYTPTSTNTVRYRDALASATLVYEPETFADHQRLIARYGTVDIINAALADIRAGRAQLMDDVAARIILGLQDRRARDAALSGGEESDLAHERQLWGDLARRCVPPYADMAPPLLTLLGWVAWREGDTVTAAHAFSDAIDIDPGYDLAETFLDGVRNGTDPAPILAVVRKEAARFEASRDDLDNL